MVATLAMLKYLKKQSDLAFSDHTGRVSMGAVKALLADVYLTYNY